MGTCFANQSAVLILLDGLVGLGVEHCTFLSAAEHSIG